MPLTYEEADNHGTLTLSGELTLAQAEELRMLLIKAIINVDDLSLAFGEVADVDLSCLQLLCSAHRSAVRMNRRVAFSGEWPERFRKTVHDAGYARTLGCSLDCDGTCLWIKK